MLIDLFLVCGEDWNEKRSLMPIVFVGSCDSAARNERQFLLSDACQLAKKWRGIYAETTREILTEQDIRAEKESVRLSGTPSQKDVLNLVIRTIAASSSLLNSF
jgi:hypothetical protein